MSSYVVDPKTINIIVSAFYNASRYEHIRSIPRLHPKWPYCTPALFIATQEQAAELGDTLYEMNKNATQQRYGDKSDDTLPGTYGEDDKLMKFEFAYTSHWSRENLYRAINEYLYQCSEGDVDELPLFKAVKEYHDRLAHHIADSFIQEERAKRGDTSRGW